MGPLNIAGGSIGPLGTGKKQVNTEMKYCTHMLLVPLRQSLLGGTRGKTM